MTEFAYRTSPQIAGAAPYRLQASYLAQAIRLAREQPNVDMFVWFGFRDTRHGTWKSGLLDVTGRPKPSLATFATAANCYRLVADPCVQAGGKLTIEGDGGPDTFGSGLALSGDGTTAVVGAPGANGNLGAAWVYTRSGSSWSRGAELLPADETGAARAGARVALSADGKTAVLGGPWDDGGVGAAWVFVRTAGGWTAEGPKLVAADPSGVRFFGAAVALSADGSTALVGAHGDGVGAAYVFARSASGWLQTAKLVANDESGAGRFGVSVALSGDGGTALVGGWNDDGGPGAAWVFVRSPWGWLQQGPKLVPNDASGAAAFGDSAALSADGSTALVGGEVDRGVAGAAWVFVRAHGAWVQQGPKLTARGENGTVYFGKSVALSADGSTALIGASGDDAGAGAAWVFGRSGSTWAPEVGKLTGSGAAGAAAFGKAVALAADGDSALVGGPLDGQNVGAVWTFVSSPLAGR
ncbi:MAG TPA: hypothetical protein VFA88_12265 [Gaiellaceae bacterium]|nr:hypothetical protein [Gaiellaceae bacterium]